MESAAPRLLMGISTQDGRRVWVARETQHIDITSSVVESRPNRRYGRERSHLKLWLQVLAAKARQAEAEGSGNEVGQSGGSSVRGSKVIRTTTLTELCNAQSAGACADPDPDVILLLHRLRRTRWTHTLLFWLVCRRRRPSSGHRPWNAAQPQCRRWVGRRGFGRIHRPPPRRLARSKAFSPLGPFSVMHSHHYTCFRYGSCAPCQRPQRLLVKMNGGQAALQ